MFSHHKLHAFKISMAWHISEVNLSNISLENEGKIKITHMWVCLSIHTPYFGTRDKWGM